MSIERIFRCDGPECARHVQTTSDRPPVFVTVREAAGRALHFCTWDCVLRYAAEKPPTEVVLVGDPD